MIIGAHAFYLEFDQGDTPLEEEDPSHYMYETTGKVIALSEGDRRMIAGRFRLYYVDVCAADNAGEPLFDIFDTLSTTIDYYPAIFQHPSENYTEQVERLFGNEYVSYGNVLILDRLEILPRFRSLNLGLIVMRRLIERFGSGAALVAIKPFPLQCEVDGASGEDGTWRRKMQLQEFAKHSRIATAKLRRHYAKLGFRALRGTPFMLRLADMALPTPDALASRE